MKIRIKKKAWIIRFIQYQVNVGFEVWGTEYVLTILQHCTYTQCLYVDWINLQTANRVSVRKREKKKTKFPSAFQFQFLVVQQCHGRFVVQL